MRQLFCLFLFTLFVQINILVTVKPALSGHSKRRPKFVFKTDYLKCRSKVLQNAPREHSAIRVLSTFTKLPFVIKTFVLSIFEWPLKVSNGAKIRNRYNQVPHLTQDTNGKVTNSQKTPQTRAKRSALSQQVTTKHI